MPTLLRAHAIRMANGLLGYSDSVVSRFQNARAACAKLHNPMRDGAMCCPAAPQRTVREMLKWTGTGIALFSRLPGDSRRVAA